jgi:hypothetical protein
MDRLYIEKPKAVPNLLPKPPSPGSPRPGVRPGFFFADTISIMDYELLTSEKQRIIMDLAEKAIFLRPALASFSVKSLNEKIEDFARTIARSIEPVQ